MIAIDKDVPLPERSRGAQGRPVKYPFAQMEVGDSFAVVGKGVKTIYSTARRYGKGAGTKYTVRRSIDDFGEPVARVWRTE